MSIRMLVAICFLIFCSRGYSQETRIEVDAGRELHRVSRWLTGACIEDVNHEIYGGIYSQMIFGESFQELSLPIPIRRFKPLGSTWRIENGELLGGPGDGPKLVSDVPPFTDGEVSVDIFFQEAAQGNSGMIVRLSEAGIGADNFEGYEISLNQGNQTVLLNLQYQSRDRMESIAFQYDDENKSKSVSSMWRPIQSGTAEGDWSLDRQAPYIGSQSQSIQFVSGEGTIGIENRGLNRWGMSFVGNNNYEAIVWAKSEANTELWACLESQDGSRVLAEERLTVKPGPWQRFEFQLTDVLEKLSASAGALRC